MIIRNRWNIKRIFLALVAYFVLFSVFSAFFAFRALSTTKKAVESIQLQDLPAAKTHVTNAKNQFKITQKTLLPLTPFRIIPLFGWYVSDIQRGINAAIHSLAAAQKFTEAITPYADVLGLEGEGTFLGGTAQERLANGVAALSKASPQLDGIGKDLVKAKNDVNKIASWRYPNFLPGKPGTKIDSAKLALENIESLIVDAKPLIEVLPQIMGQEEEKKYLILFQNDKELRPTGGFITAYAIFRVNKGIMESEGSSDIYQLDGTLLKRVAAPEPIVKYLPGVFSLNIRDSNLSPDFLVSMKQFQELYENTTDRKEIDGIIAIDTQFVMDMINVLGPLEAFGEQFTTEHLEVCACPQIIYELELFADQPTGFDKGNRKGIIGVLMQDMMTKTFTAPKSTWPKVLDQIVTSLQNKNILLSFKDPASQEAVEKINFAGRLNNYDGDYLHINETNFAGAKSNLYIEQKVRQEIKKGKDDSIVKKVTIDYRYPRRMDNCNLERTSGLCLAGIYRDWIRIYVPKGSKLIKASGTEVEITAGEDLGKTVFEGFFTIRPEGTAKIELEYSVPIKTNGEYRLLIQKQPGTPNHTYEIDAFGKKQKGFPLERDKELVVNI